MVGLFVGTVFIHAVGLGHMVVIVVSVIAFGVAGLYRPRLSLSVIEDLPYLVLALLAALTISTASLGVLVYKYPTISQIRAVPLLLGIVVFLRAFAYAVLRQARRRRHVCHRTLILGVGDVGLRLARDLQEHAEYGLQPVGFVDSRPPRSPDTSLPVPLLGGYERLTGVVQETGAKEVVVAFGATRENDLVDILRTCDRLECEIFFIPRLFELHALSRDMDSVWGTPLVRVHRAPFRTFSWRLKRLFDIVVAGIALAVLAPVMAVCAAAVRLETGPGVLFRQTRVGLDGRPFELLKFRSLKPVDDTESQTRWNISLDGRLGPVGRILRRTSLDEFPQLWNVLKGDMSLVGPRPERPYFVEQFSGQVPRYLARHRVPAGLTGWAQVHGLRGDTSIEDRARFDNHYIENWSLTGDIKILLMTLGQVLRSAGR